MNTDQNPEKPRGKLLLLFGVSLGVCLIFAEVLLGLFFKEKYYLFFPNITRSIQQTHIFRLGTSSEIVFTTNSLGIRGDQLQKNSYPKILALGGSTTESITITQSNAWPQKTQTLLAEKLSSPAWVGNAGKSGLNSRHHTIALEYYLDSLPEIDTVLVLMGINDLLFRLGADSHYQPNWSRETERNALMEDQFEFMMPPPSQENHFLKKLRLYQVARKAKTTALRQWEKNPWASDAYYNARLRERAEGEKITNLPDLTEALEEYQKNIQYMIEQARAHSVEIIFMTQPVLWHEGMTDEEESYLWMGKVSAGEQEGKYYSPTALEAGMNAYNQTLLETCEKEGITCFDLAAETPKSLDIFYDDCHYNEAGSLFIAQKVSEFLLKEFQKESGL